MAEKKTNLSKTTAIPRKIEDILRTAIVGLMALVFVLDLFTSLGYAVWVFYLIPLWLTRWEQHRLAPPIIAAAVMALTIWGFFLSPVGISETIAFTNRTMIVIAFWLTALLITNLRHSEEGLRESEERLCLALNAARMSAWEFNPVTSEVTFSDNVEKVLELPQRIENSDHGYSLIHPDDVENHRAKVAEAISTGGRYVSAYRHAHGENIIWLEEYGRAVVDSSGKTVRLVGVVQNITKRKQVQDALRASEEILNLFMESATDGFILFDSNFNHIMMNQVALSATGLKKQDVIGKNIVDVVPGIRESGRYNAYKEVLRTGTPLHLPDLTDHSLAAGRHIELTAFKVGDGLGVTFTDITKRKQAEYELLQHRNHLEDIVKERTAELETVNISLKKEIEERTQAENLLRESETRFRTIASNTPDHILMQDRQLKYTFVVNPQLGLTEQDMIGKTDHDFLSREDADRLTQIKKQVLESGQLFHLETSLISKSGELEYFDGTYTPIIDAQGQIDGLIGYFRNVTEHKKMEEIKVKLEEQNRQLQKSESLSRMAGAIAHTFNNHLAVVIGNLEFVLAEQTKGTRPNGWTNAAMKAAEKAAEVSGLMLTYLGQSFDKLEAMDIAEICRRNMPIMQSSLRGKVMLETDFSIPGPAVKTNEKHIHDILTNLFTNAWEAVGAGHGSIHLGVKTVSSVDIPERHRYPANWQPKENAYASLEVTDTGVGIAENDIEKLFDPFFSTKFTGRGMGLAVTMGIVKAHNGAITLESKPGHGSTFRVFLPLAAAEPPKHEELIAPAPKVETSGAVLLVDDEEMVCEMAAAMLSRLGFSVIEAGDGVEAVELFLQHRNEIRLVISDLTMPRLDGWETLTALRKIDPDIPVILASGYDKASVMAGNHPELPQVFLGKPYRNQELKDAISQALISRKQRATAK